MNLPDELINMICEKTSSIVDLVNLSVCSKRLNFICRNVNYVNNVYDIKKYEYVSNAYTFNKNIKLKLELNENEISDVSMLGNVYDLNLTCCEKKLRMFPC